MKQPAIRIIGSGNAAWSIGTALHNAGIPINGIFSRNLITGKQLAARLNAKWLSVDDFRKGSGICFICVQDRYIITAASVLKNTKYIPVHTSGSTAADVLKSISSSYGVFYPVASMVKGKRLPWKKIPVCIEGSNRATVKTLKSIGDSISNNVTILNSEQRQQLHMAAVFANNFANACWSAAYKLTTTADIPFSLLLPLITSAVDNIQTNNPATVQTGPAARNDKPIIELQEKLLTSLPAELKLYKALTKYITSAVKS